jgi:aldose 1-epimerase
MKYKVFGQDVLNRDVIAYTLENTLGMCVTILSYGGIIQSIEVPVGDKMRQVVLGYENMADYLKNPAYLGATIGRTAGRLANGTLNLDGVAYKIQEGSEPLLHGGPSGFHQKLMKIQGYDTIEGEKVILTFEAKAEEDGFPGDVQIELAYLLKRHENKLLLKMTGKSKEKTYLNITNHTYFNLSKNQEDMVTHHEMMLHASAYAPIKENSLPLDWRELEGTPMDFRHTRRIDVEIDHPFLLKSSSSPATLGGRLISPDKALTLDVWTTQAHMVVYTGNFLHEAKVPSGKSFKQYQGICFETQEKPNLINDDPGACRFVTAKTPYSETIEYVFY